MKEEWKYTPYNKDVDNALNNFTEEFEYFNFYKDFKIVLDYINSLENIIYGHTE